MAYLYINGASLSLTEGQIGWSPIGEGALQAIDGSLMKDVSGYTSDISCTSILLTLGEAETLQLLLQGEGHHWGFDETTYYAYSSRGLAKTLGSGTVTTSGGFQGGYVTLSATHTMTWAVGAFTAWTILVHKKVVGVWTSYIVRSDGAKWVDGVRNDAASTPFLGYAGGILTLGDTGSGAGQDFDDLVFLPYLALTGWCEQWGVRTLAFGPLPKLRITGDVIGGEVLALGEDFSSTDQYGLVSGTWTMLRALDFTLLTEELT